MKVPAFQLALSAEDAAALLDISERSYHERRHGCDWTRVCGHHGCEWVCDEPRYRERVRVREIRERH